MSKIIGYLKSLDNELVAYILIIFTISIWTYFSNYANPPYPFWDENYHVASAQKYIDGIMFMEPHPPLGKMIIALGELIVNPNSGLDLTQLHSTDYIRNFPTGYSFAGVRLMPVLFAMFSSVIFFLILKEIAKNNHIAFLFTSLFLFSNAYIVHSRAAMLDSIQMFFIFVSIYLFIKYLEQDFIKKYLYIGISIGLAVAVKLNGLILILLFLPLLYMDKINTKTDIKGFLKEVIIKGGLMVAPIVIIFLSVFWLHFAIGKKMGFRLYFASKEYKEILQKGETANIFNFPIMLRDNIKYMKIYNKNVPKFNPCKKGENGSFCLSWPFGNKSINYRWLKKDGKVSYLYLQINPIIWLLGLIGIFFSFSLIISKWVFGLEIKDKRLYFLTIIFSFMYISYMIVMYNIPRVMYLYHYFIPLFFSLFLFFIIFNYIFKEEIKKRNRLFYTATILLVLEIIYTYNFFSPLTYYKPLNSYEFMMRSWFDFWHLTPIN